MNKLKHEINTKGSLFFEQDNKPEYMWAQRHTLVEVDDDDNVIEFIDEFYLSDYEDGHIIDSEGYIDYEWNGYSEDWSEIDGLNNVDALVKWNKYKNKFK